MDLVIAHVGLHKTATTYLQKEVFPHLKDEIGYIPLRDELYEFLRYILDENDISFSAEKAREIFDAAMKRRGSGSDRITFSDEQFCGSPWDDAAGRVRYAQRLKAVFPRIRFFLVVREQAALIRSLYQQYVKIGGPASLKDFLSNRFHPLTFSRGAYLRHDLYADLLASLSGDDGVLVLPYEQLKADRAAFIGKFAAFHRIDAARAQAAFDATADVRRNPSLPPRMLEWTRRINLLSRTRHEPFRPLSNATRGRLLKLAAKLPGRGGLDEGAIERYLAGRDLGNAALARRIGVDLRALGYR